MVLQAAIHTSIRLLPFMKSSKSIFPVLYRSLLALAVLGLVSCATAPDLGERIAMRQAEFQALSPKHQELVQNGQIASGMSTTAVSLAWGSPSRRTAGEQDGRNFERWTYSRQRAQTVNSFGFANRGWGGPGWGRYGYGGPGYWGGGFQQTDVIWIPEEVAFVKFVNNRVTEWRVRQ